jgi:hypothetical protein
MRPCRWSGLLGRSPICRGVSLRVVGWRWLLLPRVQTVAGTSSGTFRGCLIVAYRCSNSGELSRPSALGKVSRAPVQRRLLSARRRLVRSGRSRGFRAPDLGIGPETRDPGAGPAPRRGHASVPRRSRSSAKSRLSFGHPCRRARKEAPATLRGSVRLGLQTAVRPPSTASFAP